jgi:hypothetical protein
MLKRLVLKALAIYRTRQSRQIPYTELQAIHLKNLQTIVDREALLGHLPRQGIVAEVGVLRGDFSQNIFTQTQPRQLHLIDTWEGAAGRRNLEQVKNRFAEAIQNGQVILHQGLSTEVLKKLPENNFDWLYLDTDHTYPTTAAELECAAKCVKNNGLILGHDYVTGNWNSGVRYGVIEAVNEFCVRNNWEFLFLTAETHRHLSFGVKRIIHHSKPIIQNP